MRKVCSVLIGIFFTLAFTTCKQFTENIEDYLSYWASEAFIRSASIEAATQADGAGIASVASEKDVIVALTVQNPKSFRFVMPSASESRRIIDFAHLTKNKLALGGDYTLEQTAPDTVKFTYKQAFLQRYEWGTEDIGAEITLIAEDGRVFKKTFTMNLKANTQPPKPDFTVAKTVGTPAYYVLCITVPDEKMKKTVQGGALLHKDITRIEVNGAPYTFSVDEAHNTFIKPESDLFITASAVEKLTESNAEEVPTGGWVLYYKTDVEVKDGAAKKEYTLALKDQAGVTSETLSASTKPNKVKAVTLTVTYGTAAGGSGSEDDPYVITAGQDGTAKVEAKSDTASATVHCTVAEAPGGSLSQQTGNPVTITMPLNGENEKRYKLTYAAEGEGFTATAERTVYYRITLTPSAPNTGTAYKVEHYQQNIADDDYTLAATDDLRGTTGENAAVTLKNDLGFEAGTYTPATIAADGSTVVKVYYKRKTYTVHFSVNDSGGSIAVTGGSVTSTSPVSVKHGGEVTFTAQPDAGYKVKNWTLSEGNFTSGGGTGKEAKLTVTGNVTVAVEFELEPIPINGADAWARLKIIIEERAFPGRTLIVEISDEVKAAAMFYTFTIDGTEYTNCPNWGEIEIKDGQNITIRKAAGATSAILNANKTGGGTKSAHRIFKVTSGTLTLENLTLTGGIAPSGEDGGAIYAKDATVKMTGCTLTGNTAGRNGGGVCAEKATVKMTNCTLTKNTAGGSGGGIVINGSINNTITNCTITGNKANKGNGGGVYAGKSEGTIPSTVTISGGAIGGTGTDANEATTSSILLGNGGGIFINTGCTVTLEKGVQVIGNTAKNDGGGVYAWQATINITGCTITDNKAEENGGGVDVNGGKFTMTGGEIKNNHAKNGGGVYIYGSTFEMTGGSVSFNEAKDVPQASGGGVYVGINSTFKMYGGTITNNTITGGNPSGKGVYVAGGDGYPNTQDADFIMGGEACVGNWVTGTLQDGNDVYLGSNGGSGKLVSIKIDKDNPITKSKVACITPKSYSRDETVVMMTTDETNPPPPVGGHASKFTVTPQTFPAAQEWEVDSEGKLQMK